MSCDRENFNYSSPPNPLAKSRFPEDSMSKNTVFQQFHYAFQDLHEKRAVYHEFRFGLGSKLTVDRTIFEMRVSL